MKAVIKYIPEHATQNFPGHRNHNLWFKTPCRHLELTVRVLQCASTAYTGGATTKNIILRALNSCRNPAGAVAQRLGTHWCYWNAHVSSAAKKWREQRHLALLLPPVHIHSAY